MIDQTNLSSVLAIGQRLTSNLYPDGIESYSFHPAHQPRLAMDLPLKIRICYPLIPMLSDLRHGIVLGTHICSIRPFIYYPIWFVLEYRWCYPWLLSAWYQVEFTSSTSLSDELSIQGLGRHDLPSTCIHSPHWGLAELECCRVVWVIRFLSDTEHGCSHWTSPRQTGDRDEERAEHVGRFGLGVVYNDSMSEGIRPLSIPKQKEG